MRVLLGKISDSMLDINFLKIDRCLSLILIVLILNNQYIPYLNNIGITTKNSRKINVFSSFSIVPNTSKVWKNIDTSKITSFEFIGACFKRFLQNLM